MSARYRKKNGISYQRRRDGMPELSPQLDDSNVAEGYAAYDPSLQDHDVLADPTWGNAQLVLNNSPGVPGPKELFHAMPENNANFPTAGQGIVRDNVDWEVGGQSGIVNNVPWSMGVVESSLVEDFNMRGEQAIIRRQPDPNRFGAVSTADPNSLLSISYAQAAAQYWPNEASQGDLVRAV